MWEVTNVQMGFDTPFTAIQDFRTRLRQYVADNPREWGGGCAGLSVYLQQLADDGTWWALRTDSTSMSTSWRTRT